MEDERLWDQIGLGSTRRKRGLSLGPNQWKPGDPVPTFTVNGKQVPLVRKETRGKLQKSVFSLVISSNVRHSIYQDKNSEVERSIKGSSDWLFSQAWQQRGDFLDIFNLWTGTKGHTRKLNGEHPKREDIADLKWENTKLEYGTDMKGKGRRIHYQGILKVWHYSKLRVNQKRCQSYINYMTTGTRNQYVYPQPPLRFISPYIKGVYVNSTALSTSANAKIYNEKSLINPYIDWLKTQKG